MNLTLEDFQKLVERTAASLDELFRDAFGVGMEGRFPEIKGRTGEKLGGKTSGYLIVQGLLNRNTDEFPDEESNVVTDESGRMFEISTDLVALFLGKIKPASVHNDGILDTVMYCWADLKFAQTCAAQGQPFEAVHFLADANQALGNARMLLELRQRGRERARKAGKQRHAQTQKEKRRARMIFREHLADKGLSNEQAASKLLAEFKIGYNRGGVKRLISETRKELEPKS